jgi:hypothetical protein
MMRFPALSLSHLEEMLPFEREVYYSLIIEEIERKKAENGAT